MDGAGPQRSRSKERSEDGAVKGTASGHPDEHCTAHDSYCWPGDVPPVDFGRGIGSVRLTFILCVFSGFGPV